MLRIKKSLAAVVLAAVASAGCTPALQQIVTQPSTTTPTEPVSIVYSETYIKLTAENPSGMFSNGCALADHLAGGGGVCTTEVDPVYVYPDGTFGSWPWIVEPSSPTGWSIAPHPCDLVTDDEDELFAMYAEFMNDYHAGRTGALDSGPALTDEQRERFAACFYASPLFEGF